MSLRARMVLGAAGAVAVAVVLAAAATYVLARGQLRGEVDDSLQGRARAAAAFGVRLESSRPFPAIPVEPGAPRRGRQLPAGGVRRRCLLADPVVAPVRDSGHLEDPCRRSR